MKRGASNINKLIEAVNQINSSNDRRSGFGDDRFWKIQTDASNNGYAVIRFLPEANQDSLPWAQYMSYGFKGPSGKWYIENSLRTFDKPDPVAKLNTRLWNTGSKKDQDQARRQAARTNFVSNIVVIEDPVNPSNNGKVFLYRYGKKIFEKITSVMQPEFQDEQAINPFDLWEGANFKLKVRQVAGFVNYDKSEFSAAGPLFDGDKKKIDAVVAQAHSLSSFTDPSNSEMYKSYDQLQAHLNTVLNEDVVVEEDNGVGYQTSTSKFEPVMTVDPVAATATTSDSDLDSMLEHFKALAQ